MDRGVIYLFFLMEICLEKRDVSSPVTLANDDQRTLLDWNAFGWLLSISIAGAKFFVDHNHFQRLDLTKFWSKVSYWWLFFDMVFPDLSWVKDRNTCGGNRRSWQQACEGDTCAFRPPHCNWCEMLFWETAFHSIMLLVWSIGDSLLSFLFDMCEYVWLCTIYIYTIYIYLIPHSNSSRKSSGLTPL